MEIDKDNEVEIVKTNKSEEIDAFKVDEKDERDDASDLYEWILVPAIYPDDKKTGFTFKGDTQEYILAHGNIF